MHLFSSSHACIRYSAGHTRGQLSVDLSEARQTEESWKFLQRNWRFCHWWGARYGCSISGSSGANHDCCFQCKAQQNRFQNVTLWWLNCVQLEDLPSTTTKFQKFSQSRQCVWSKSGQSLYKKYLEPNGIVFTVVMRTKEQRNSGLLAEICDRMQNGQLTDDDCTKLTYHWMKFPSLQTDFGIHYENESRSVHNWHQLWTECSSTEDRRMFLCKMTYHTTSDN